QLDRFLFKTLVTYPPPEAEAEVLRRYNHGFDAHQLAEAGVSLLLSPDDLTTLRAEIRTVTVEDGIMRYITSIAGATRTAGDLAVGGSPASSTAHTVARAASC